MDIGKLQRVELRKIWEHEEYDFSAWLAIPENLQLLSDEIGVTLINPQTENGVGSFSADIVAEEENGDRRVLIENQLEQSNHDHLGKLMTYGAGLDAEILIWIVKVAREEHEQAITWLNEHTDEKLNLFLVQIEAWQIGNSAVAPRFNIIAKPNDWAKSLKASRQTNITEYKLLQQKFWEELRSFKGAAELFGTKKPRPQHWFNISIGSSVAYISLTLNSFEGRIGCELYMPKDAQKTLFEKLYGKKDQIQAELGMPLEWMRLDDRLASRIKTTIEGNIESQDEWPQYFDWLVTTSKTFKNTFKKYLR